MVKLSDSNRIRTEHIILQEIVNERDRQISKWGPQTHGITEWLIILGEEYGEACKAGLEAHFNGTPLEELKKELVQTAAVAVAILEGIETELEVAKKVADRAAAARKVGWT